MIGKKHGIPFWPNLITTGNIFAGFYSIIHSIQGDFDKAAWAIVIGGILDNLDGRVARLTNSQSEFGVQYDSLSDFCTFGFAPAMLAYFWALKNLAYFPRIGWLAAFFFVACAALRLARFNVQGTIKETDYFHGLPSPGAAGTITATVLFHQEYWNPEKLDSVTLSFVPAQIVVLALVYLLALLMVSGVKFYSFKSFSLKGVSPFRRLVLVALLLTFFMVSPELFLFLVGVFYLSSGLIYTIFVARRGVLDEDSEFEDEPELDGDDSNISILPS